MSFPALPKSLSLPSRPLKELNPLFPLIILAALLPVARFKKASAAEVYRDSRGMI